MIINVEIINPVMELLEIPAEREGISFSIELETPRSSLFRFINHSLLERARCLIN